MSELHAELPSQQPSLRDQFAMAALPSIIDIVGISNSEDIVDEAYRLADMMLSAKQCFENGGQDGTENP
jgi:hypothetical protein